MVAPVYGGSTRVHVGTIGSTLHSSSAVPLSCPPSLQ